MNDDLELVKTLVEGGAISANDAALFYEESKKENVRVENLFANAGKINQEKIARAKAFVCGVPFVNLKNMPLSFETLSKIPEPIARTRNIVAFKENSDEVEVAALNLDDLESIKCLPIVKIKPRLTSADSMAHALRCYQLELHNQIGVSISERVSRLKNQSNESDVEELLEALIRHALLQNAHHVHIEPFKGDHVFKYRLGSHLYEAFILATHAVSRVVDLLKSKMSLKEGRMPQDGSFIFSTGSGAVYIQASFIPMSQSERVVMKISEHDDNRITLHEMGFDLIAVDQIVKAISLPGLVLIGGPKKSGKTTSLRAIGSIVNNGNRHVGSVGEGDLQQLPSSTFIDAKKLGIKKAQAVDLLIKHDTDIIFVDDIDSRETFDAIIKAANAGRVVVATMESLDTENLLQKSLDFASNRGKFISNLRLVLSSKLVNRLKNGGTRIKLTDGAYKNLSRTVDSDKILDRLRTLFICGPNVKSLNEAYLYSGEKSDKLIVVSEIVELTSHLKELLRQTDDLSLFISEAKKEGMLTYMEDLIVKSAHGIVSVEEAVNLT